MKKCKRPCRYRSSTKYLNGCDYLYLTGKMRGCPAGDECTRYEEGPRMNDPTEASKIDLMNKDIDRDLEIRRYNVERYRRGLEYRQKHR